MTFALLLFTIIGGFAIGARLRAISDPMVSLLGEGIIGLGFGALVGVVSIIVVPFGYY